MRKPKFSVIIANYNNGHLINEALESIKIQSTQDFEVIVVDDGSTDNSRSVIEFAASSFEGRLRYLYQENKGVSGARNTAMMASTGEYITFLDPDDFWHEQRLTAHADILDQYEGVGFCCSDFDRLYEDGRSERHFHKWVAFPEFPLERPIPREDAVRWLLRVNFAGTNGVTLRRSCLEDVGLFNENYKQAEDYDYWLRCGTNTNFYVIPRSLHAYRIHQGGLTKNFLENCEYSQIVVKDFSTKYDAFIKLHGLESAVGNSISRRWYEIGNLNFESGYAGRAFLSYLSGLQSELSISNFLRFMSVATRKTIRLATSDVLSKERFGYRS